MTRSYFKIFLATLHSTPFNFKKLCIFFGMFGVPLGMIACSKIGDTQNQSNVSMTFTPETLTNNNFLLRLSKSNGRVNLLIDLSNANQSSDLGKIKTDISNSMLRAMNLWNSALAGYSDWNVTSISLANDQSAPQLRIQYASGRPLAIPSSDLIILVDPQTYDGSLNYQSLHEYGHILGLYEAYTEPGRSVPKIPQASSVMQNMREDLTQEDVNSIRFIWDVLKGKANVESCPPGYVNDKNAYSHGGAIFCAIPTTSSDTSSKAPKP